MPTRVEEICRKIHILFARGEAYQNSPDLVILSKQEMFSLLEQLNEAMYEVLDQYEATERSKEKARLETEREASEIIGKAKRGAEDVQAASLAYTDTMLDELSFRIEAVTSDIKEQYLAFLQDMDEKLSSLKDNREQLKNELESLNDRKIYLKLLEEIREEEALKREESEEELEDDSTGQITKEPVKESTIKTPSTPKQDVKNTKALENEEELPPPPKAPEPVIRVNRPGENPGVTFSTKRSHNKKRKTAPPAKNKARTMSEEEYNNMSPEEREELEQSTPAYGYGFTADDFDLDAEYEQFKQEQSDKQENPASEKKQGFRLFGKKK